MVVFIVIGRILLGLAFLVFGIRNLKNVDRLTGVLEKKHIPMAQTWIYVGIAIQIVGGLAVASGFPVIAALGAAALIAFLYLAVFWFHDYWSFPEAERYPHITAWIMNTALAGGMLMVVGLSI